MHKAIFASIFVVLVAIPAACFAQNDQARVNDQTRALLERRLPMINFQDTALYDVMEFLRDVSGANVHVNWKALEAAGIKRDGTVTLKLRDVSLRKVLNLVLSEAGSGLTYMIDEGVIEITTREMADGVLITMVYPVDNLLVEPPDVSGAMGGMGGLGSMGGGNSGGGSGGSSGYGGRGGSSGSSRSSGGSSSSSYGSSSSGGSSSGFGGGSSGMGGMGSMGGGMAGSSSNGDSRKAAEELIDLIVGTVSPSIWVKNGGKSSIKYFKGALVITAPRSVHERIGGRID